MKHSQPRRRLSPTTVACADWLCQYLADAKGTHEMLSLIRTAREFGFHADNARPAINDLARRGWIHFIASASSITVIPVCEIRELFESSKSTPL